MSEHPQSIEITGTVRPDGILVLDGPVALQPGRVTVTVRPVEQQPDLPKDDPFWQRMQAIWDGQKTRGHVPRSAEEIDAEIRELREGWDERQQEIERLQEACRAARESPLESPP